MRNYDSVITKDMIEEQIKEVLDFIHNLDKRDLKLEEKRENLRANAKNYKMKKLDKKDIKTIKEFINYLDSNNKRYEFIIDGYNYDNIIYDFISYCYNNEISISYKGSDERIYLQNEKIENMIEIELRKYIFMIFYGERFAPGEIMKAINNNNLKLALERLLEYYK